MEFPVQVFEAVPSTNDTIRKSAEEGAPEGTTHIARTQTHGRGREGRAWWSPPGAGLWMSTLLRPPARREAWSGLALVSGAAVVRALSRLGVRGVELEWPNDVVVGGRKLGGILCEVGGRGGDAWIALGIGVNIDLTTPEARDLMPDELRERVTCMTREGPPSATAPEEVARAILEELGPLYERFVGGEKTAEIVGAYLGAPGQRVEVSQPGGNGLRGTVAGLGADGELQVMDDEGRLHTVVAGEVRYER